MKKIFTFSKGGITPVATPTDFIVIQGANGILGLIKRITVSALGATAAGVMTTNLIRRNSAGTVAALTSVTAAKHDPNSDSANVTVGYLAAANYTALGNQVGQLGSKPLTIPVNGASQNSVEWEYRWSEDEGLFLRGSSDFICFNLNGDAVPAGGAAVKFMFEIVVEEMGVR